MLVTDQVLNSIFKIYIRMGITPIFIVFLVGVYSSVWRLKKNMFDIDYFDEHSSTESTTVAIPVDLNYKPSNISVPDPLYGELSVDAPVKSNRFLNDTLAVVYAPEFLEDIGNHTNSTQKINSNQSNTTVDTPYGLEDPYAFAPEVFENMQSYLNYTDQPDYILRSFALYIYIFFLIEYIFIFFIHTLLCYILSIK